MNWFQGGEPAMASWLQGWNAGVRLNAMLGQVAGVAGLNHAVSRPQSPFEQATWPTFAPDFSAWGASMALTGAVAGNPGLAFAKGASALQAGVSGSAAAPTRSANGLSAITQFGDRTISDTQYQADFRKGRAALDERVRAHNRTHKRDIDRVKVISDILKAPIKAKIDQSTRQDKAVDMTRNTIAHIPNGVTVPEFMAALEKVFGPNRNLPNKDRSDMAKIRAMVASRTIAGTNILRPGPLDLTELMSPLGLHNSQISFGPQGKYRWRNNAKAQKAHPRPS